MKAFWAYIELDEHLTPEEVKQIAEEIKTRTEHVVEVRANVPMGR